MIPPPLLFLVAFEPLPSTVQKLFFVVCQIFVAFLFANFLWLFSLGKHLCFPPVFAQNSFCWPVSLCQNIAKRPKEQLRNLNPKLETAFAQSMDKGAKAQLRNLLQEKKNPKSQYTTLSIKCNGPLIFESFCPGCPRCQGNY